MIKNRKYLFITIVLLWMMNWSVIYGQESKSTEIIDTIVITDSSLQLDKTQLSQNWVAKNLSHGLSNNLGTLLSRESNVFIKSYGSGSLSTAAIRGGNAGHTSVLWNGMNIQSPTLGLSDISLLPIQMFDEIYLYKGGASSIAGDGAIGGVIDLNNIAKTEDRLGIALSSGSFGLYQYNLQIAKQIGKVNISSRFFHRQSENDFTYQASNNLPKVKQSNNRLNQKVSMSQISYAPKANEKYRLMFWWHDMDRQIPPTTTQNISLAQQFDHGYRIGIHWDKTYERLKLNLRSAYIDETNDYEDPQIGLSASNQFIRVISELNSTWHLNTKSKLLLGLNCTHTRANSSSYIDQNKRSAFAIIGKYQQRWQSLQFAIQLREQLVDGKLLDPIPSVQIVNQFQKHSISLRVSRDFRLATLNDLYWNPGGNTNLKPESGWSQEIGFKSDSKKLNYAAILYSRKINNWILWTPIENSFVYAPNNLTQVWSRGIELSISQQISINKRTNLNWTAGYDFTKSTNEVAIEIPKINQGDQLVYVPNHQAYLNLNLNLSKIEFKYYHRFIGGTQGQLESIPAYYLSDLSLYRKWSVADHYFTLIMSINNLWNKKYRVIERRPMPGRNYEINFQFEI